MVHRAPDARLLTNVIANEKEYTRHLASLFPLSHAALASLSAYAAASPATPARTIASVVDLLASADDALQRYNHTVDTWREQLLSLKTLEDDLSAVLRDRDILVTRLIKASKATRDAHRSSRIMSLGSASFSSLPSTISTAAHYSPSSTNPTTITGQGSSPSSTNAKLAQAQAELQACEAHLVAKERELDARRISVARDGLGARCRALIDCGWVWGEMGKQGLRALQALSANGPSLHTGSYPTYASDNSSLTPSQSASQTAARSAETSHEGATSKEHEKATSEGPDADVTLTLPPAHAISDFTVPTGVRSRPPQDKDSVHDSVVQNPKAAPTSMSTPTPGPRRKRTRRAHRPPSQFIVEVSDEGSDPGPFPSPTTATTTTIANATHGDTEPSVGSISHTPFPTTQHDASSDDDDERPAGAFQVVENDPFEVIRRSMLGTSPSVPLLPVPPGMREGGLSGSETGPASKGVLSLGRASGTNVTGAQGKRERRTSMAFLGSLRGLFRKPKARGGVEWGDASKQGTHLRANGDGRGWVTRTDARMKSVDSEDDVGSGHVQRGNSGRLRKGRPRGYEPGGAGAGVGLDGWVTDSPRPSGPVTGAGTGSSTGAGLDRAKTRRETVKRRKTSVADLRGSEQGHTDGEVEKRTSRALTRAPRGKVEIEVEKVQEVLVESASGKLSRRASASASKGAYAVNPMAGEDAQLGRALTTMAVSSRKPSEAHRRSASASVVETSPSVASTSTSTPATRRKPSPPPSPPASQTHAPSRTPSPPSTPMPTRSLTEVQTKKPQARRPMGNGHAMHGQSLMSIVADVTRDRDRDDGGTKSLDVPRAPGSVLREAAREEALEENGRGRGRRSSWTVGTGDERVGPLPGTGTGTGRGRGVVKMPLRSALRNASRTPSPSPAAAAAPPVRAENGDKRAEVIMEEREKERVVSLSSTFRDSMSVSSYETGRESLGEEEEEEERPEPVLTIPPPPVVDPPPVKDEEADPPLVRRKSVRVSLQPTFSPSPPALEEEEVEGWPSEKRQSKRVSTDMWADSSSEEEAYQRGRALLTLVGGASRSDVKAKALPRDKRSGKR